MRTANRLASTPGSKVLLWITASNPFVRSIATFSPTPVFRDMMQPDNALRLRAASTLRHAKVLRIGQLEGRVRESVALEQLDDMAFELAEWRCVRMVKNIKAHGFISFSRQIYV